MIEIIKERIRTNYYLDNSITMEEAFYINRDKDLKKAFNEFFLNIESMDNLHCFIPDVVLYDNREDLLKLDDEELEKFLINYIKNYESKFYAPEIVSEMLDYYGLKDNQKLVNKLNDEFSKLIQTDVYKNYSYHDFIEFIINTKKYELVSELKFVPDEKDKKMFDFEKLLSVIPNIDLPTKPDYFKSLSIKEKIKFIMNNPVDDNEYFDMFVEDLKNNPTTLDDEDKLNFQYLDVKKATDEQLEILNRNGLIHVNILKELFNEYYRWGSFNEEDEDKIISLLNVYISFLNSFDDPSEFLHENSFTSLSLMDMRLNKVNIKEELIKNGYGVAVAYYSVIEDDLKEVFKNNLQNNRIKTLRNIRVGEPDRVARCKLYDNDIDIIKEILDIVDIDDISIHSSVDEKSEKYQLIKKYILDKKKNVGYIQKFDRELVDNNIKLGNYDYIARWVTSKDHIYDFYMILKNNSDNLFLFHELLHKARSYSIEDDRMINSLLKLYAGNELVTNDIFEFLNHNVERPYLLDHELFDILKGIVSKRINVDISKLELLEKKVGPSILFYTDNSNILSLLDMPEDKIEKILNLFPKVNYGMVDVEAAYESIMQYSFGEKNEEIINIFPNLFRAILDNSELVEKYKYDLIRYINVKRIDVIKEKYGIDKSLSIEDIINIIISKLNDENQSEYLSEVLHEICKEAIDNQRTFYRNNHYYIDKKTYDLFLAFHNGDEKKCVTTVINSMKDDVLSEVLIKYRFGSREELIDYIIKNDLDDNKTSSIVESIKDIFINEDRIASGQRFSTQTELKLPFDIDPKKERNAIERNILKRLDQFGLKEDLVDLLKSNGFSDSMIKDVILFYSGYRMDFENTEEEIKKNIGKYYKLGAELIRKQDNIDQVLVETLKYELINSFEIDRIYKCNEEDDLLKILSKLNVDLVNENLLDNEENYNLLLDIMTKRKPHMIDRSILELIDNEKINLSSVKDDISAFINFFVPIIESEKKRLVAQKQEVNHDNLMLSISNILLNADVYAAVSSLYSVVLGDEDAKLIKKNPGRQAAREKTDNDQRLKEAVELTVKNFDRENILVPPIDEVIKIGEEKELEIRLGDFTDPSSLTHGERTDACMRIGGAGETLFYFCLNNDAGFHIKITDPSNGSYVSRISGFRNGNTVFFNQLRKSLDENYTNSELIEVSKTIAKQLIEMTKDTDNPIENVFITESEAMENYKDKTYRIPRRDVNEGIEKCYSDYDRFRAFLLATTSEKEYVPLKPGNSGIKPYKVLKPKVMINPEESKALGMINRAHAVKELKEGKDLGDITIINVENGILYSVVCDNWYIYVDRNFNVVSEINSDKEEIVEQYNKHKLIIEEMIRNNQIKEKNHEL